MPLKSRKDRITLAALSRGVARGSHGLDPEGGVIHRRN